jgi:hypothetical protein
MKVKRVLKNISVVRSFYNFFVFKIIPPRLYVRYRFKKVFGYNLNLKEPKTFNEKLQWKKFNDHNPIYTLCSDKYLVRKYVKEKIGDNYLVPLLYLTDRPEKIPFNELQPPYVIKANHGSGKIIFVYKKGNTEKKKILNETDGWLKENYYYYGKEWQYKNISPKIIIEKLLLDKNRNIPNDYKFHCFKGKVEFIQVDSDRFNDHKRTVFSKKWRKMPFIYSPRKKHIDKPKYKEDLTIKKPKLLKKMLDISESLSEDFNYVRVDLYSLANNIYFGELTFTGESGFGKFFPRKYDLIYGKKLKNED